MIYHVNLVTAARSRKVLSQVRFGPCCDKKGFKRKIVYEQDESLDCKRWHWPTFRTAFLGHQADKPTVQSAITLLPISSVLLMHFTALYVIALNNVLPSVWLCMLVCPTGVFFFIVVCFRHCARWQGSPQKILLFILYDDNKGFVNFLTNIQ